MKDVIKLRRKWTIRRYNSMEEAKSQKVPDTIIDAKGNVLPGKSVFEGNVLLDEGITNVLLPLLCGTASPSAYDNANAYLGVGDGTADEDASHTGLQGSNTAFASMVSGYPSVSDQTATWRAEFDGSVANFDWEEFTVVNASDDTGDNLNRKTSSEGTKASGQTWELTLEITFS